MITHFWNSQARRDRPAWLLAAAMALLLAAGTGEVRAATLFWNGGGDGSTWSTGNGSNERNNWGGTRFNTGDDAVFTGTSGLAPTIGNSALTVGSVTFTNGAGAFTIGGSATLNVNSGITNLSSTNQTFSVSIALMSNQTWNAGSASGGRLTFNGGVNLGASRTLTLDGANNLLLNGVVSGTGTSGLVKQGTGTTVLAGLNTFTGDVVINAGTLLIATNAPSGAAGALGNSTNTVLLGATNGTASSTLLLTNGVTIGRNIQVRAGSTGTETIGATGSAPATVSGNVELRFDTLFSAGTGSELSFTGIVSSSGDVVLTKTGAGVVRLSGANTFTGTVRVDAGTLLLGASERIANSAVMRLNGGTFNTGGFNETLGTLTLTASSVINLTNTSVLSFASSSGQSWTGGATLTVQNWSGSTSGGGAERLVFGSSSNALTSSQLSQVSFLNPAGLSAGSYAARILSTGEVVPVPEPATGAAAGALGVVIACGDRRFRRRLGALWGRARAAATTETGIRNLVMLGFALLLYLSVWVLP